MEAWVGTVMAGSADFGSNKTLTVRWENFRRLVVCELQQAATSWSSYKSWLCLGLRIATARHFNFHHDNCRCDVTWATSTLLLHSGPYFIYRFFSFSVWLKFMCNRSVLSGKSMTLAVVSHVMDRHTCVFRVMRVWILKVVSYDTPSGNHRVLLHHQHCHQMLISLLVFHAMWLMLLSLSSKRIFPRIFNSVFVSLPLVYRSIVIVTMTTTFMDVFHFDLYL